jgi:hypothetical protein
MSGIARKTPSQRLLWSTIASLLVLWAVAAGLRYFASDAETGAPGDSFWDIRINVQAKKPVTTGIVARVAIPADTAHIRNVAQNLVHPGWRVRFVSDLDWGAGRQMRLTSTNSSTKGFELGFTLRQSAAPLIQRPSLRKLSSKARERYLRNEPLLDLENEAIGKEINQLTSQSQSNSGLLTHIFKRTRQFVPLPYASVKQNLAQVIASGRAGSLERAYAMVALCRAAHIPARLVTGMELKESDNAHLHHWVEVYVTGKGWLSYDPLHGYQQELPQNFLPFVKNRADLVEMKSSNKISVAYTISKADKDIFSNNDTSWQNIFYLTRLPLEERNVLAHLLLLPLAVLLTTLFRTFTGVRSYGTYMPALFALSWVYADWRMASITMCMVLLFAVLGRAALPAKLSRQPRLTAVLILVTLAVATTISLMDYFQWRQEGKVLLLPVVITAILVDLFYKAFEKEGPVSAFTRLGWTLAQVAICLPVMQFESLGHWLVAHPEVHLLTLAATLLITGYRGKTLANPLR